MGQPSTTGWSPPGPAALPKPCYRVRTSVTVAAITLTIRHIPVEVMLDRSDGMPAHCVVKLDDILTIPKSLVEERITGLSGEKMALVNGAISFALALEESA